MVLIAPLQSARRGSIHGCRQSRTQRCASLAAGSPNMAYQPSANTRRMTYGGSSAANEEVARQELFSGAEGPGRTQGSSAYTYADDPQQMLQAGIQQHKETTETAKRAAKIVANTNEIADSTLAGLHDQRKQMETIGDDINRIGRDLSYSERLLRYMRLCCCVGFFCSCCAEPEGRNAKDSRWREQSGVQHPPPPPPPTQQPQQQQARKGKAKGPVGVEPAAPSYPRVNADGLDEESKQVIDNETAAQDDYLDQISRGLDQLKVKARAMNEEVRGQEAHVGALQTDTTALNERLRNTNRQGFRV